MGAVRKLTVWIVLIAVIVPLAGCRTKANRLTVERTTEIPSRDTKKGIAVHLDAQQRVLLSNAQGFCAEPSPDAFSAYVASIGLKAGKPDEDSLIFANSLTSISSNLGLRTQSITLMRDALYRICEATNNNSIQKWETASLLRQSQDLTAVVLAVEQLTGAVMAKPIVLNPPTISAVKAIRERPDSVLEDQETGAGDVERSARTKDNEAPEETDANDSGRSLLATQRGLLDPDAVKAVADSVQKMVSQVLKKTYIKEQCLGFMAAVPGDSPMLKSPAVKICRSYLLDAFLATEPTSLESFFSVTPTIDNGEDEQAEQLEEPQPAH